MLFAAIPLATLVTVSLLPVALTTLFQTPGEVKVLGEEVEAMRQVLEASSQPQCSLIILTDGTTSHLTHHQIWEEVRRTSGVVVLEVRGDLDHNNTHMLLSHARKMRVLSWCVTVVVVSDSPSFLATFAASSDSGRLLVWTTKMLVVTRVPLPELRHLLHHYWVFSMMNTMFLTLADASHDRRWDVYAQLPYTPRGAVVLRVACWSRTRGLVLLSHLQLFPEKFENFHGAAVNVSVWPFSPYWMEVEETIPEGRKVSRLTGRAYIILETIASTLNFSINVLPPNNLNEVMQRIEQREALMMPMKLAILPHLLEKYDYTFVIEEATLSFAMAKPQLKPHWEALYHPMTGEVWGSILLLLLLVPVTLMLITRENLKTGRHRRQVTDTLMVIHKVSKTAKEENLSQKISVDKDGNIQNPNVKAWTVVQEILGTLLGQNLTGQLPSNSSTRVLVATWLLFAFIVASAYRSTLTAFLTVPKYPARPENLEELLMTNTRVMMPPDLRVNFYNSFKQSNSTLFKTLVERIYFVPSHTVGLQQAIDKRDAYIYEGLLLKLLIAKNYTGKDGWTPLYVARQAVVPGYSAWLLPRDAPYKHNLDRCIFAFHGAGLIRKWSQVVLDESRQRERDKTHHQQQEAVEVVDHVESSSGFQQLTVTHLQGPILLLVLGLTLASHVFVGEVLIRYCLR